jgi:hypothetical protein
VTEGSLNFHADPETLYRPGKFITPDIVPNRIINLRLEEAKLSTSTIHSFVAWMQ